MENKRSYPDISFVETNSEKIINSLINAYELMTGRVLYPADPVRIFILWVADIIVQERVLINESAKQNVPRYAKGKYLDSLAEIFKDAYRLEAEKATTTFRCYISAAIQKQCIVPKGTRITVDGEITFETTKVLYIQPGSLYGDVSAICQSVGTIGNDFIPGQITQIIDIYEYYSKVENITTSAGGSDEETDEAFYNRMRESMESFSTAGPTGGYIYHTKTTSTEIADVTANSTVEGVVDIRILLNNGKIPTEEMLNKVKIALSADKTRPLTDYVTVSAPETVNFDIDLKYYISSPNSNSSVVIDSDVENAINEYKKWQTEKMGRDINPSYLISLLMKAGVKRVEVYKPEYKKIEDTQVAVINTSNVINGGIEDE